MKKSIIMAALIFTPVFMNGQEKIAGLFTTELVPFTHNQQVPQQGAGISFDVARTYLTVEGKKYSLYRYAKDQVNVMKKPAGSASTQIEQQQQQYQVPLNVKAEDFFLLGNQQENGKFCLVSGVIDKEAGIIYSANLLEVFEERKITQALNKCGIEK